MDEEKDLILLDDEITPQLLKIVGEAKQHVTLVAPFIDLWGHLQTAIQRSVQKGIKVRALIRRDGEILGGRGGAKSVAWLLDNHVEVLTLERLHAKVYLNEQSVLISSMNMTESSATNSFELALLVRHSPSAARIREYVNQRLIAMAQTEKPIQLPPSPKYRVNEPRVKYTAALQGHCIRCGNDLKLDPDKPLCDTCYDSWSEYENEDYEEKFCHVCGNRAKTSYAKPLCGACYRLVR